MKDDKSHNPRNINLEASNVGEHLTEVVRAYLHGGLPSSLIKHIKEGVDKYRQEVKEGGRFKHSSEEHTLTTYLSGELEVMYDTWKKKEDNFYGM